jgi:hypothetical protein
MRRGWDLARAGRAVAARLWPAPDAAGPGALLLPCYPAVQPTAPSSSKRGAMCLGGNCLPRLRPVNRRRGAGAGQARCVADGFWREQVAAMRAVACLNGDAVCWPAGPGAWLHPASTSRRTLQREAGAPLSPSLRYRRGPGVICLPRARTGNDHHERTLTRDTRPIRRHGAVSPGSVALIAEPHRSP